jgi:hypothetical protein
VLGRLSFDPSISKATQFETKTNLGCELSLDGEPDFDKKIDSKEYAAGVSMFHSDSAWKRSSKTSMNLTSAECTVENS